MKTKLTFLLGLLAAALGLPAFAQGTAITYQGVLSGASSTANGSYDFSFQLFDAAIGGASQGGPLTTNGVSVVNGLFTLTMDFGAGPFSSGAPRWLQIAVRTNGGGGFDPITTRQALTATPYAITAGKIIGPVESGGLSGNYSNAVTFSNGTNSFAGVGGGLTGLNASQLASGTVPLAALGNAWKISGNAGTTAGLNFLGTTDNQPLELKVNGQRAVRLEWNFNGAPNVIAGSPFNRVDNSVVGATIGGGGATNYNSASYTNRVSSDFGTISGGIANTIQGNLSTIGGGYLNTIQATAFYSSIGGGNNNTIQTNASESTIGGGVFNVIENNAWASTIGGGDGNTILNGGGGGTIPGGTGNTATNNAFASGTRAKANHTGSFVWADFQNADFASTAANQFLIRASGGVGIGTAIPGTALDVNGTVTAKAFSAPNGSAGGASYTFQGDPNTGLFHPIDNTLGFTTTGEERMHIESSGNVGIGTNNPSQKLHVIGNILASGAVSANTMGIGTTNPEAPLHVAEGSAGTVGASANAIAVFERAGNAYLSVLTPTNSESGLLFGSPTSSVDGGVLFNANVARGLSFRTGGNSTKMVIQSDGFVGIGTQAPTERLHVIGNILASGTITGSSDRNVKEHFDPVNPREVLDRVASLPISRWNYKTETDVTHLGPMAQDFYSAFQVGMDDKHISMVDADGVALAAIQGLNQKVEEQRTQLEAKQVEITNLEDRLARIERMLTSQATTH